MSKSEINLHIKQMCCKLDLLYATGKIDKEYYHFKMTSLAEWAHKQRTL